MSSRLDNLELLSDEELRLRLVEYGFQNMPVTSTTRKLLIKKLRNHMENEKGKLRRETSYATRYSSGEESDGGDRRKSTAAGRRTIAATAGANSVRGSMPPPPARPLPASKQRAFSTGIGSPASSVPSGATNNANRSFSPGSGSKSSVYISPVIINDSEEEEYSNGFRTNRRLGPSAAASPSALFRRSPIARGSVFSSQSTVPPAQTSQLNSNSWNQRTSPVSVPLASVSSGGGSAGAASPFSTSPITARASISPSLNLNGNTSSSSSSDSPPFVNDYTKRLLQLRGETVSQEGYNSAISNAIAHSSSNSNNSKPKSTLSLNHSTAPISGNHFRSRYSYRNNLHNADGSTAGFNENDIVTHAWPAPDPPQVSLRAALSNLISKLDEHYGFKQTFIPCALLCLFVGFLVSVAFMYMTISTDIASTLSSIDTRYELCESSTTDTRNCAQKNDIEPALEMLKLLGTELKVRVEHVKCVDSASAVPPLMSADEVLKLSKQHNPTLLIPHLTRHLHTMEYLIAQNPQWKINHCDGNGVEISFEEVLLRRSTKTNYFAILRPKLPFTCALYNKFRTFFLLVGCLALVALAVYPVRYFLRFVLYVKQKRKSQVNALIAEIIQAVSQEATSAAGGVSGGEDATAGLVVVNHLRDRLIAPENRKKLEWAWVEALQFLEQNESRIQFEVGTRGGEDFKMMRWIDTSVPPRSPSSSALMSAGGTAGSCSSAAKKWQSPAFDNANKIPDPPTPCLKIRQMFDKYEVNDPNLKTIVQDAILEKVGTRCKIYDIQLDRSTCCVYVRCATPRDAGIVHDEINGWWFDNRLVSIKFLRLERYLARFPRSAAGPACLKPSNRNNSSMSQQQQQQSVDHQNNNNHDEDDDEEAEEDEEDELAEQDG